MISFQIAFIILLLSIGLPNASQGERQVDMSVSFASGGQRVIGPLTVASTTDSASEADDSAKVRLYHERLFIPGQSEIAATFHLDKVPDSLYLMINARTEATVQGQGRSTMAVLVNHNPVRNMTLSYDQFVTIGVPIVSYCHPGTNSVEVMLPDSAPTDLWIRDIAIEQIGSFTAPATAGLGVWGLAAKLLLAAIMLAGVVLMTAVIDTVLWRGIVREPVKSARYTLLTLVVLACFIILVLFGFSVVTVVAAIAAGAACSIVAWKWQAG